MPQLRQQILILYLHSSDLTSSVCAWSYYDSTGKRPHPSHGDAEKPPYHSVVAAMMDGWRVIQVPQQFPAYPGTEYTTSFLKFEFVLEKMVEISNE